MPTRRELRPVATDLTIAGLLFVFGIFMLAQSFGYGLFVRGGRIGPGFMPFVSGALVAIFSVWTFAEVVWRARRSPLAAPPAQPSLGDAGEGRGHESVQAAAAMTTGSEDPATLTGAGPEPVEATPARGNRTVMVVFGLTIAATALTYAIGYILAFGLMTFVMLAAVERERLWLSALVGAGSIVVTWAVFLEVLAIPLPGGALHLLGVG